MSGLRYNLPSNSAQWVGPLGLFQSYYLDDPVLAWEGGRKMFFMTLLFKKVHLKYCNSVIAKIISGVPDKMSSRHSVLCWTFWFPVGHFAIWKCPANLVFFPGHFHHIDHYRTKCLSVLELSARYFKIVLHCSLYRDQIGGEKFFSLWYQCCT